MNHVLSVRQVSAASVKAADICRIMDEAGVEFAPVEQHCWAEAFPYCPRMEVRLAHNGSQLLINYRVMEDAVRAVAPQDDCNVWEDSCCELFISPVSDGTYYNIECNAAGTMLIGFGPKREGRERAPQHVLDTVDRWSSLGREPFDTRKGSDAWQLCLAVPLGAFYRHSLPTFAGIKAKANVYKCGDKLPRPHFLSFFPINIDKPDFHRPDFFGDIVFE